MTTKTQIAMFAIAATAVMGIGLPSVYATPTAEHDFDFGTVASGTTEQMGDRTNNVCGSGSNGDIITDWVKVSNDNPGDEDSVIVKYDASECTTIDVDIEVKIAGTSHYSWNNSALTGTIYFTSVDIESTDQVDVFIDYTAT